MLADKIIQLLNALITQIYDANIGYNPRITMFWKRKAWKLSKLCRGLVVHLRFNFTMLIFKEFTFDSAHFLPNVPVGHKCREMHGHTYRLRVWIEDKQDPQLGWVMDFADLKKLVKPVVAQLDHKCMNNVPGLENPTCEMIAVWIWNQLKPLLPKLAKIELHETPTSGVIYEGK